MSYYMKPRRTKHTTLQQRLAYFKMKLADVPYTMAIYYHRRLEEKWMATNWKCPKLEAEEARARKLRDRLAKPWREALDAYRALFGDAMPQPDVTQP